MNYNSQKEELFADIQKVLDKIEIETPWQIGVELINAFNQEHIDEISTNIPKLDDIFETASDLADDAWQGCYSYMASRERLEKINLLFQSAKQEKNLDDARKTKEN